MLSAIRRVPAEPRWVRAAADRTRGAPVSDCRLSTTRETLARCACALRLRRQASGPAQGITRSTGRAGASASASESALLTRENASCVLHASSITDATLHARRQSVARARLAARRGRQLREELPAHQHTDVCGQSSGAENEEKIEGGGATAHRFFFCCFFSFTIGRCERAKHEWGTQP